MADTEEQVVKFAADRMVGRLARWLRLIGADVIWDSTLGGAELLRRARAEGRIVLTRDKRLRTALDAIYLASGDFRVQLREVMGRFKLDSHRAFTRCLSCNEPLIVVSRDVVARRVPPFVYASCAAFAECPACAKIYWRATHPERVIEELARIES